jgi:hypothetical protein
VDRKSFAVFTLLIAQKWREEIAPERWSSSGHIYLHAFIVSIIAIV